MRIVLLYDSADGKVLGNIETYLKPLKYDIFYKALTIPGSDWREIMREKVKNADIIIPLVSASYLADVYEMRLLDFAASLQKDIRPYLVSKCLYEYNSILENKKFITMQDIVNFKPTVGQQMPIFTRPVLTTAGRYSVTDRQGNTIALDNVHLVNILCALVDASNKSIIELLPYAKTMLEAVR